MILWVLVPASPGAGLLVTAGRSLCSAGMKHPVLELDLEKLLLNPLLHCFPGHGEGFDDVVIQGDLDELKFVAFYTK